MIKRPSNHYSAHHAHIYFDTETVESARDLCETAGQELKIAVRRVHTRLVGPHPHWSCQLSFDMSRFDEVIK